MRLNSFLIFQGISDQYISLLEPLFERFTCTAGTTVIEQGAAADFLYLIESGSVEISYKPYDSDSITISHIGVDGLFGWSALIGGPRFTSTGIAAEDFSARRIRGADLRKLCKEHPEAGQVILDRLAGAVSKRWKNAHEQVKSILEAGMKT